MNYVVRKIICDYTMKNIIGYVKSKVKKEFKYMRTIYNTANDLDGCDHT